MPKNTTYTNRGSDDVNEADNDDVEEADVSPVSRWEGSSYCSRPLAWSSNACRVE